MKKLLLLLTLSAVLTETSSQVIHKIKADSVLITNDACNAELNLENSTKHIKGFLYNKGNGRTEFRRAFKLNDSTLVIGNDTLSVGNGNGWLLSGNSNTNPNANFLGTTDNQPMIFKTNNIQRATITSSKYGGLIIGSTNAEGTIAIYGRDIVDTTSTMTVSGNINGLQWGNTAGKTMGRLIRLNQGTTVSGGQNFYDIGIGQDTSLFITNHSVPPSGGNGVIRKRMFVISTDDKVGINLSGDIIGNGARPTANLHSSGTVRFQNLPAGNGFIIVSDANGNLYRSNESLAGSGGAFWSTTGNTGSNPATQFIGTTDNQSLTFKTKNVKRLSMDGAGAAFTFYDSAGSTAAHLRINGSNNQFMGLSSGMANTTGIYNTAYGPYTLLANTTGSYNTAVGSQTLYSNTTGLNNAALGTHALFSNTAGAANTALGVSALRFNTEGNNNTAIGGFAMYSNSTGFANTATGFSAMNSNTTGNQNVANGYMALYLNSEGNLNTAIGSWALKTNTTGSSNTALGNSSLFLNTTGRDNTAIGVSTLYSNTTGNFNIATGTYSLFANTSGTNNVGYGVGALKSNSTGSNNTATGGQALFYSLTAGNNSAYGYQALHNNTEGANNTAVGAHALWTATTGNNNIAIGAGSSYQLSTGSYNQVYGSNVQAPNPAGNGQLNIGNVVYGTNLFQGPSLSSTPVANGNIGIGGVPASCAKLDITSTTQGLLLPRMTKAQRDAIASPVAGLMIFQADNTPGLRVYNGTNWVRFTEVTD